AEFQEARMASSSSGAVTSSPRRLRQVTVTSAWYGKSRQDGGRPSALTGIVVRLACRVRRLSLLGPPFRLMVAVAGAAPGSATEARRVTAPVAIVLLKRKRATPPAVGAEAELLMLWLAPVAAPTWPRLGWSTLSVTMVPSATPVPRRETLTATSVIESTPRVLLPTLIDRETGCGGWAAPPLSPPPPPQATSQRQERIGTSLSRARIIVFSKPVKP